MELNHEFDTFQGDVDIFSISEIPTSATRLDTKTVMLGEVTGHHHTFGGQTLVYQPKDGDTVKVRDEESVLVSKYVQVLESDTIHHQEHAPQEIPPGMYAILQEREWNVMEKQINAVVD